MKSAIFVLFVAVGLIALKTGYAADEAKPPTPEVKECVMKHAESLEKAAMALVTDPKQKEELKGGVSALEFFTRDAGEAGTEFIVKIKVGKLIFHINALLNKHKELKLQKIVGPKKDTDKLEYIHS